MCGHAGVIYRDAGRVVDKDRLLAMGRTIAHRGPDDEVPFVRGPVGAIFRRLSIIDLEGGAQPIANEDETVFVLCNGEIYNFRALRAQLEKQGHRFRTHSDCETLVHLYEEHGDGFVDRLVGMFAFAILDLRGSEPRVLIGRDRVGIKPLYWADTEDGFLWGSEPKALLEHGGLARDMRGPALLDYLVQGYIGGPESAWAGVHRLAPGSTLAWSASSGAREQRYWDMELERLSAPVSGDEILSALDTVVSERLVADVPLGAFLSGGIDSTAVVTSMARGSDEPVIACSVGFREKSHDELDVARRTAQTLGATHHTELLEPDPTLAVETLPWFYDEPLADPSTVPTYLVSRMAREHVTVALSGDGGDETFAGYRRYVHDVAENHLRARLGRPGRALVRAAGQVYPELAWAPRVLRGRTFLRNVGDDPAHAYWRSVTQLERSAAADLLAPELRDALREHDPFHAFREHYERPKIDCPLYRAQYADVHTYLCDQILAKVDRASMGVSLEVRVPILDHRFLGRFAQLPAREKVRAGRGKHAFREALRGRLDGSVLDGQKRGFDTPLREWIRGPLRASVHDAVEGLPAHWFDRAKLRTRLAEHDAGRRDHGRLLWSLLVLEAWRTRHGVRNIVA